MGSTISSALSSSNRLSSRSLAVFKGDNTTSSQAPSTSASNSSLPSRNRFFFPSKSSKKEPEPPKKMLSSSTTTPTTVAFVAPKPDVVFTPGMSLGMNAKLNYSSAPMGTDYKLSLLASLAAQEQEEKEDDKGKRNPIDLVIVLDRSGSMAGQKLQLCKETLEFLLDNGLTEQDFLAIVTFDTYVKEEYTGGKMTAENKSIVREIIKNITHGSSTNLSDGLYTGLNLLSRSSTADVSAVCILTDGLMNHGITDPEELIRLTKQRINGPMFENKAKPSVFTFGYGTDVDADMLKRLSEAADGTFYRIENPESVPLSFADCLGGLTSVSAQSIELQCDLGEGVEFASDPLTKYPFQRTSERQYTVKIKDMYCGEQRDLIFQLNVKASKSIEPVKIKLICKYTDTINETFHTMECTREISRYMGTAAPSGPPNVDVLRHFARFEAIKALEQAQAMGRTGDMAGASKHLQETMKGTSEGLSLAGVNIQEDIMMSEIMRDMEAAKESLKSREEYDRRGAALMSAAMQSHDYQRSNQVEEYRFSDEAVSKSAWAGGAKKKMIQSSKAAFNMS